MQETKGGPRSRSIMEALEGGVDDPILRRERVPRLSSPRRTSFGMWEVYSVLQNVVKPTQTDEYSGVDLSFILPSRLSSTTRK